MSDLVLKYYLLSPSAKKEVVDFIDFLLAKGSQSKVKTNTNYKNKLLKVSVWSDSDIDVILQNQKDFE